MIRKVKKRMYAEQRFISSCAFAQCDQNLHWTHVWIVKDTKFLHVDNEDSNQILHTDLSLHWAYILEGTLSHVATQMELLFFLIHTFTHLEIFFTFKSSPRWPDHVIHTISWPATRGNEPSDMCKLFPFWIKHPSFEICPTSWRWLSAAKPSPLCNDGIFPVYPFSLICHLAIVGQISKRDNLQMVLTLTLSMLNKLRCHAVF